MSLYKYIEIGKINFFNSIIYKADMLANSLFIGLIIYIFINLWTVVYSNGNGVIEGFTITMMIWYLVMTESIVTSSGKIIEDIGGEIQSGEVAHKLNKPYNYILYHFSSSIIKSLFRCLLTFIIGGTIALLFIGGINITLQSVPFVVIAVLFALTLHFMIMAFIGVFAFWLEDAKGLNFIYNKIVFVLGGMLLPLDFFPFWLSEIAKNLPFSYIAYFPAKLFVQFNMDLFMRVIIGQIAWIALFSILIILIYHHCFKKISINGG